MISPMSRPTQGVQPATALALASLAALAAVSLADLGATRMFLFPWSLARWVAVVGPWLAVAAGLGGRTAWRLPSGRWLGVLCAVGLVLLASAVASPWPRQSLLWCGEPLSLIPWTLLAFHYGSGRSHDALVAGSCLASIVGGESALLWANDAVRLPTGPGLLQRLAELRNPHPLGHSNYTAGLCLLLLPWPVALIRGSRTARERRLGWLGAVLVVGVLATTGSRGAILGLGAGACVLLGLWRPPLKQALAGAGLMVVALAALYLGNPRIRALTLAHDPQGQPDLSHVQRSAMAEGGWLMGLDRPFLGWGVGTTPLAYPRYRLRLNGGVDDALELHSAPVQLWAETGALGLIAALALLVLSATGWRREGAAAIALGSYAVFALTDWQGDIPAFAGLVGGCLGLLASPETGPPRRRPGIALAAAGIPLLLLFGGAEDPTPMLNARALALGAKPASRAEALRLFDQSLAINPDQEVALFNRGWLEVAEDPGKALHDFTSAMRLVPDRSYVYLGRAVAAMNRKDPREEIVNNLAAECLNNPSFIASPWWRDPTFAALRPDVLARTEQMAADLSAALPQDRWPAREAAYLVSLVQWFEGKQLRLSALRVGVGESDSGDLPSRAASPVLGTGPVRQMAQEMTGYPVLMRNAEIGIPRDILVMPIDTLWQVDRAYLFPPRGWAQAPLRKVLSLRGIPLEP